MRPLDKENGAGFKGAILSAHIIHVWFVLNET